MSKVVGYRYVSYTSKKDGKPREGYELHVESAWPDYQADSAGGVQTEAVWVGVDMFLDSEISIGDEVDLLYNKHGRLIRIVH